MYVSLFSYVWISESPPILIRAGYSTNHLSHLCNDVSSCLYCGRSLGSDCISSWSMPISFNQFSRGKHLPCLMGPWPSSLARLWKLLWNNFKHISFSNPKPLATELFCFQVLLLNKLSGNQLSNTNKTKKKSCIWAKRFWDRRSFNIFLLFFFFFFFFFFVVQTRDPWTRAILDHGTTVWTNLVKDDTAMLHITFQVAEPSSSGEKGLSIFYFWTILPAAEPLWVLRL